MNQRKIYNLKELQVRLKEMLLYISENNESVGFITHNQPDGDGLATCLAFKKILLHYHIKSDIILQGDGLDKLSYLDVADHTISYNDKLQYDNLFILDCHSLDRIGKAQGLLAESKRIMIIDHHIPTEIIANADYYIDEDMASAGMILYYVFQETIKDLESRDQKYVATAVYTTIINDTNNFLNTNTNKKVFQISGDLLDYQINPAEITTTFLYSKTPAEFKMIGQTMSTIQLYHNQRTLVFYTSRDFIDDNGLDNSATSKMTNWVKGARDVEVVLYYWQVNENEYKFSIRSDQHNVQEIAHVFAGGGHKKASGFTLHGNVDEKIIDVLHVIQNKIYE